MDLDARSSECQTTFVSLLHTHATCHAYIALLDLITYQWLLITSVNVCRCVYVCAYVCAYVCVCVYVSRHLLFLLLQR